MEPVTAIALAKGIAKVTGLNGWFKSKLGGTVTAKAAGKIADLAMLVTGQESADTVLDAIEKNPELAAQLKSQILENENSLVLANLEDLKSARNMYLEKNEMADKIADRVIRQNHWLVALLLVANGAVMVLIDDKVIAVALGNLIGVSVNSLWQERQQIIGFFFHSSLGSKMKTLMSMEKSSNG
ncbi:hypothetical protein OAP18_03415 [Gammaproteobacteria bacterium]|nr:hypothetical protein [Gammaproteobacteria bacterium]